jgi:hypothetical protein
LDRVTACPGAKKGLLTACSTMVFSEKSSRLRAW